MLYAQQYKLRHAQPAAAGAAAADDRPPFDAHLLNEIGQILRMRVITQDEAEVRKTVHATIHGAIEGGQMVRDLTSIVAQYDDPKDRENLKVVTDFGLFKRYEKLEITLIITQLIYKEQSIPSLKTEIGTFLSALFNIHKINGAADRANKASNEKMLQGFIVQHIDFLQGRDGIEKLELSEQIVVQDYVKLLQLLQIHLKQFLQMPVLEQETAVLDAAAPRRNLKGLAAGGEG